MGSRVIDLAMFAAALVISDDTNLKEGRIEMRNVFGICCIFGLD